MEVSEYHANIIPKGPRAKKKAETPDRIKKSNLRRRADRLRQLMNANFNDKEFWSMTLTYRKGEEPATIRQVRDDASDFVKRLRKCARLFGVELKFIYVIGAGKHRRHIHITVNALPDMAIFKGCWTHGHVSMTQLYSDGQYRDLADYYIKNAVETREQEEALGEKPGQMYVPSKNLAQPEETREVIFGKFKGEPQPMDGYYLEKGSVYKGMTSMGFPLLRYTMLKEKWDGNDTLSVDERKPQKVGARKIHVQGGIVVGKTKPDKKRRIARSKPSVRNAGSIGGLLKGVQRESGLGCLCGLLMPRGADEHKSALHRKVGEKRLCQLQRRGGKVFRPLEDGRRPMQGQKD